MSLSRAADSRLVAMSNPSDNAPLPAPGSAQDAVDGAVNSVEHQLSVLWRRARAVSQQLSRQVHPDMEPAAYGLLAVLRREGPMRLTDLAQFIGVGKPSVSRQIAFLEQIGLIAKEADPKDGRAQILTLTTEGEAKMHDVQDARQQVFRERLHEWPLAELRDFAEAMAKLNATYERDGFPSDSPN